MPIVLTEMLIVLCFFLAWVLCLYCLRAPYARAALAEPYAPPALTEHEVARHRLRRSCKLRRSQRAKQLAASIARPADNGDVETDIQELSLSIEKSTLGCALPSRDYGQNVAYEDTPALSRTIEIAQHAAYIARPADDGDVKTDIQELSRSIEKSTLGCARDYGQNVAYEDIPALSRTIESAQLKCAYALNLGRGSLESDNALYVGSTLRPLETRMREHWGRATDGFPGAQVTKLNPPLSIHTVRTFDTAEGARQGEIELYEELEEKHGSENVRGAYFCSSWPGKRRRSSECAERGAVTDSEMGNMCSRCGYTSHTAETCYARRHVNGKTLVTQ